MGINRKIFMKRELEAAFGPNYENMLKRKKKKIAFVESDLSPSAAHDNKAALTDKSENSIEHQTCKCISVIVTTIRPKAACDSINVGGPDSKMSKNKQKKIKKKDLFISDWLAQSDGSSQVKKKKGKKKCDANTTVNSLNSPEKKQKKITIVSEDNEKKNKERNISDLFDEPSDWATGWEAPLLPGEQVRPIIICRDNLSYKYKFIDRN